MARILVKQLVRIALMLLVGGFFAVTLIRYAPGFDSDEQMLDSRLSSQSVRALRAARAGEHNVVRFYAAYLAAAMHGDFGVSRTLNRPVGELVKERLPVTLKLIGVGLLAGWSLGLIFAVSAAMARFAAYDIFTTALS